MKKNLLFLLLCVSASFKAQMPILSQYFDGANTSPSNSIIIKLDTASTNVWQIGKPQKPIFNSASTLPNVIVTDTIHPYPVKNTSRFTFYVTGYYPYQHLSLRWKQKLDSDKKKDGAIVEYSSNSGAAWNNVFNNPMVYQYYGFNNSNKDTLPSGEFSLSGTDAVWRDIWLCFNPGVLQTNDSLYFRFTFKSDSVNTNKDGWMIDNLISQTTVVHPVKEISEVQPLMVYPSYTSGIVNVELQTHEEKDVILTIEVTDTNGKVFEKFIPNTRKTIVDIGNHLPGLYFLRVTTSHKTLNFRVILEKN